MKNNTNHSRMPLSGMDNINKEINKAHPEVSLLRISRFLHEIKENALLITTSKRETLKQVQGGSRFITTIKAFTLIELLVVVLIIGILAAVAVPQYQKAVKRSRCTEALVNLRALTDAQELYALANGSYADGSAESGALDVLDIKISDGAYFHYTCAENRTCHATPKSTLVGYPSFEFHMKNKYNDDAHDNYLGKRWCVADVSDSVQNDLCKTFGTLDIEGSHNYYVLK